MSKPSWIQRWITQNGSYKVVALFVALVLWVAILGRKDFVLTYDIPLKIILPVDKKASVEEERTLKVKVGGSRLAVQRFRDANEEVEVSIPWASLGRVSVRIQESDFVVPPKVRLISISPSFLSLDVIRAVNLNETSSEGL